MLASVTPLLPRKDTLSAQVARYLLDYIVNEGLEPGDPAPSEVQLSRELKISRGIVREAYRTLATLGILQIEAGKQPRVEGLGSAVLTQLLGSALRLSQVSAPQVLELRRAVEVEAARLAAFRATQAQLDHLQHCVAEMQAAGADHERMIAADVALHTTLAEATGNPLFAVIILGLRGPLEESMSQGLKSRRSREEVARVPDFHKSIVQRLRARDGEGAARAMARHFDVSTAAILAAGVAQQRAAVKSASKRQ